MLWTPHQVQRSSEPQSIFSSAVSLHLASSLPSSFPIAIIYGLQAVQEKGDFS